MVIGVGPLSLVRVERDHRRGVTQGELYPFDTRAVMDQQRGEVVPQAVQANSPGDSRLAGRWCTQVRPGRPVDRPTGASDEQQAGRALIVLPLIGVGAILDLDFGRRE
jgi:hypothetical protein